MRTVTTPGDAFAASTSMAVIVPCANGLRTMARCSIPGSWMLSVQRVRPVMSRWSSLRSRPAPISRAGRSSTAVIAQPPSVAPVAAACTAVTMFW